MMLYGYRVCIKKSKNQQWRLCSWFGLWGFSPFRFYSLQYFQHFYSKYIIFMKNSMPFLKELHCRFLKIMTKYRQHKIYHLNHFKLYNAVALCMFAMLYNHRYYLVSQIIYKPHIIKHSCSFSLHPGPGNHIPAFCHCGLPILDISYKWLFSLSKVLSGFIHILVCVFLIVEKKSHNINLHF